MSDNSKIEWTDASWNPVRARNRATGKLGWHCEHVTTGCEHCYAEAINRRLGTGLQFKPGHRADVEIFVDQTMLTQPLRWKKPRKIFVGSMTDLFADFVTDAMLDRVFAVMALCPQHTFQVLTKRAARMLHYLSVSTMNICSRVAHAAAQLEHQASFTAHDLWTLWPLPNVWLGVSAERQEEADARIPLLLQTPAAVRFLSAEPLLGPIDLEQISAAKFDALSFDHADDPGLNWIIVGGESGARARPMHPQWARDIRDQCAGAGVAFFFKQWGEWLSGEANYGQFDKHSMNTYRRCDNHSYEWPPYRGAANFGTHPDPFSGALGARRVGKKAAGRLLDGREWNEMPASPAKAEAA